MKKITTLFVALFSLILVSPAPLLAQAPKDVLFNQQCSQYRDSPPAEVPVACQEAAKDESGANNSIYGTDGVLTRVVNILAFIIGIAAIIVIIVAGIQMIVAVGDASKIAQARNAIIYATIGLVVAAFAQVIIRFVLNQV